MPKRINLAGKKFNWLTVIEEAGRTEDSQVLWKCVCDCGNEVFVTTNAFKSGRKKSCGCKQGGFQDHTGERFGRLTAIECVGRASDRNPIWLCVCDCGNTCEVTARNLVHGHVKSCGCLKHEGTRTTHNESSTRLYGTWNAMKQRCGNENNSRWKDYGGRGISVCEEWMRYESFRDWAIENGYDENAPYGTCTLDRIDVDGDYEPLNCRWVDMRTQGNNTRVNRLVTVDGVTKTLTEWSRANGISQGTIYSRIRSGWSAERAVTEEVHR